jgi:hypothetical protein
MAFSPSRDHIDSFSSLAGHHSNITSTPAASSPVTAVTGRDGFAVDLTFVQTYSQAQGDV